jgi:peptidoglycan/xylan/chitin deacetylase (PgdA/CDA1 family)
MTVITVTGVPAGYTATMTARVGTGGTNCDPFTWRHGPGVAVSQTCYVNLPTRAGSWAVTGTATLTKAGSPTWVYRGATSIETRGNVTTPVSTAVRAQITKCYNTGSQVLLTFDDGFTSQANLNSILATLKANNVRGRFFLIGSWARTHTAMVNQIKAGGHYVENHTSNHPKLTWVSDATVRSEIASGLKPNTAVKLLRPPTGAGAYTTRLYNLAAAQGYRLCYWGTDTRDWSGVSAAGIVDKVVHGDALTAPTRAGDTVLMHLSNTKSAAALPALIKALRAKGLQLAPLR